jgi:hypothetical protein
MSLKVGIGYSTLEDPKEAGMDAANKALAQLGGAEPTFTIAFCTVQYNEQKIINGINKVTKRAPLWGGTSSGGVWTPDGFIESENGSVGVAILSSPNLAVGVAATQIRSDGFGEGEIAMKRALGDVGEHVQTAVDVRATSAVGQDERHPPDLVLMCAPPGVEEGLIRGIRSAVPTMFPIVGGTSADNTFEGQWKQFADLDVYSDYLSVACLYTKELKVGYSYSQEYKPLKQGKATKAKGRTLYEIDGRPAAEVYAEWTGKSLDAIKGGAILKESFFNPIGIAHEGYWQTVHPGNASEDLSIDGYVVIPQGADIAVLSATQDELVMEANAVFKRAIDVGSISQPSFGLLVHCAGCRLAVGDRVSEVVDQVKSALGDTPFIGCNVFGEQATTPQKEIMHCNLALSTAVFGT